MAIKNGVPVVAIDSVQGGAKITRQVQALEWPVLLAAQDVSVEALRRAFDYCLTEEARTAVAKCRGRAVTLLADVQREFLRAFAD